MSGLSHHLCSGQTGSPVGFGEIEEAGCVGGLEGLEGPELWTRELGLQDGSQAPANDELASVISSHFPPASASTLANGLHLQRRVGPGSYQRRQTQTHTNAETLRNMQTHVEPDVHAQSVPHTNMDDCGAADISAGEGSTPEAAHTTSPQSLSLPHGSHPAPTNQLPAPVLTAETDIPSNFCPVAISPNPNAGSTSLPVESEKKYALRSSGRPRFPCHLRKSSRLRRSTEDGEKRAEREKGEEQDAALAEKIWRVKEEEMTDVEKDERSSAEVVLPTAPYPTEAAVPLTVPKQVPKALTKPGPRLGHRPGPKSRSRPAPKSVQRAGPKSVMRHHQTAQHPPQCVHQLPFASTSTISAPRIAMKKEVPVAEVEVLAPNGRRRGRYFGVSSFMNH